MIVSSVIAWYVISAVYNIWNKYALQQLPEIPWTIASLQLGVGVLIVSFLWQVNLRPFPFHIDNNLSWKQDFFKKMMEFKEVTVFQALTHAMGVFALGLGAVSFTQIVKAAEPLFTVALSSLFLQQTYSNKSLIAIVMIIVGVGISSYSELSFSWLCLLAGLVSNIFSSARGIRLKQMMNKVKENETVKNAAVGKMTPSNQYAVLTVYSFLLLFPISVILEAKALHQYLRTTFLLSSCEHDNIHTAADCLEKQQQMRLGWVFALLSGILFYAYNELSFTTLENITPTTHAILNTLKRVVVIVSSTLIFHNNMSALNMLGASLSIVGVFLYSLS